MGLKICILSYRGNPYSGGQGIYLKYMAEELVRQGHEVHAIVGPPLPGDMKGVVLHTVDNYHYRDRKRLNIINPASPFDIFKPLNFYQYLTSRLGAFPEISAFGYRAYLLLRELCGKISFDVIHDNQCLAYGLLLMKTLGIPVTATIHHPLTIDRGSALERFSSFTEKFRAVMFYPLVMQGFVARRLDRIITVSVDSKRKIHEDFGVPPEKQRVVYNGVDQNIFRPLPGVKKIPGKIIFVGNVEDGKKGLAYLLKALPQVPKEVRLTVVDGGSPHRRLTGMLIGKLGIQERVEFTGNICTENLVRHYCESEIAVVPSVYEGFGLPAAEAMACGVPVIASDGGALPEVVGECGEMFPVRDYVALAHTISALFPDKKKLAALGEAGMERVKKNFNWTVCVEKMVEVFRGLV